MDGLAYHPALETTTVLNNEVFAGDIFHLRRGRVPYFALMSLPDEQIVQGFALNSKRWVAVPWNRCIVVGHEEPPTFGQWLHTLAPKYKIKRCAALTLERQCR